MFANLKNKLIEEVKASPSKFQQFANAAQAAVSSSTSSIPGSTDNNGTTTTPLTLEDFFSITEEDTPQNSPLKPLRLPTGAARGRQSTPNSSNGAIPRTRRLSNSSMASDVSFRLPTYESSIAYHMQSDLDETGSEMDDSASTTNLNVITKEQLFEAYKKSLDRYNKYRGRYTDLAKKYKELERDSAKARSVLVETQDKALRRVSELREQCSLEQQAKAHLEEALRMEIDDLQCKMETFQTKLRVLGENAEIDDNKQANALITLDTITTTESGDDLKTIIKRLEQQLQEQEKKIKEYQENEEKSKATIDSLRKQDEENVILMAQTKQAIHSELEGKEKEVLLLKETIKQMQSDLQTAPKSEQLLESHMDEMKDLRNKLKQYQTSKQEVDAKVMTLEHMLTEWKEKFTTKDRELLSLSEEHSVNVKDSEQKAKDMQEKNFELERKIESFEKQVRALEELTNDLQSSKQENDKLSEAFKETEEKCEQQRKELESQKDIMAKLEETLRTEKTRLEELLNNERVAKESMVSRVKELEMDLEKSQQQMTNSESETVTALKAEVHNMKLKFNGQLSELQEQLDGKDRELSEYTVKYAEAVSRLERNQLENGEQSEVIEKLQEENQKYLNELETMSKEASEFERQSNIEKQELQSQVSNILQEVSGMEEQMRTVQQSHSELEQDRQRLADRLAGLVQQEQDMNEELHESHEKCMEVEEKTKELQMENGKLKENNALLEQSLQKLLRERELQLQADTDTASDLRVKLDTVETDLQKLNEKMSEVLDENTRMHNAQELMEHSYRTLQDKYDALEKANTKAEDSAQSLLRDIDTLKEKHEENIQKLNNDLAASESTAILSKEKITELETAVTELKTIREQLQNERDAASKQLNDLRADQSDDQLRKDDLLAEMQRDLAAQKQREESLKKEHENEIASLQAILNAQGERETVLQEYQSQLQSLKVEKDGADEKIKELQQAEGEYESVRLQLQELKQVETKLLQELEGKSAEEANLKEMAVQMKQQFDEASKEISMIKDNESKLRTELADNQKRLNETESSLQTGQEDIERLHEANDCLQLQMDELKSKQQLQVDDFETTVERLKDECEQLKNQAQSNSADIEKVRRYDEIQIENEFLNKSVQQLETQLSGKANEIVLKQQEHDELKEKSKSMQCELYVLQENTEKHRAEMEEKDLQAIQMQKAVEQLKSELNERDTDIERQKEHVTYITEQNDSIQKDLLTVQGKLEIVTNELEVLKSSTETDFKSKEQQIASMSTELENKEETIEKLNKEMHEITEDLQKKQALEDELQALKVEINERNTLTRHQEIHTSLHSKSLASEAEHLRDLNGILQRELEELKQKSQAEIGHLQHELQDIQSSSQALMERLMEHERKEQPSGATNENDDDVGQQKEELEAKLKHIMNEVQDVSNRNLFLEQKCENFLILEQSNERLKLQNAKLSRQLDETLVSMQHTESLTANTEFEYLKNIMFQYLTGSANGNNETLVKVISAVLKFSPQQTQVAIEKEHQRRSLINKII